MAKDKSAGRFVRVSTEGNSFGTVREVWVDKQTGVNYVWFGSGNAGGLTVLLDRDGKPVVSALPVE